MKTMTFAVAALLATLSFSKLAQAQTACYDTLTPLTSVTYTTQDHAALAGDVFASAVCSNVTQVDILFVADVPGNYGVTLGLYPDYCFNPSPPAPTTTPLAAATAGVYQVTFTVGGGSWLGWAVYSSSNSFTAGYANQPDIVNAADVDGFTVDLNPIDNLLTPGATGCAAGTEWYTFNPADTNWNMAALFTNTPSPQSFHGPALPGQPFFVEATSIRKVDIPAYKVKGLMQARPLELKK